MNALLNAKPLALIMIIFIGAPLLWSAPEKKGEVPTEIQYGRVLEAFPFVTDGTHTGSGMVIGAIGGTSLVDTVYGPCVIMDDPLIAVLGTVAGGVLGMKVEKALNSERLVQIYVLRDDGQELIITQPQTKRKFRANDAVKILHYGQKEQMVYHREQYVEWEKNPYVVAEVEKSGTKP